LVAALVIDADTAEVLIDLVRERPPLHAATARRAG
jgi:hypothetical protein